MSLGGLSRLGRDFAPQKGPVDVHFGLWIIYNIAIASSQLIKDQRSEVKTKD